MTGAAGSESWAYQADAANLRSVHANQLTTNGIMKPSTYYFDLAGNLTQIVAQTTRSSRHDSLKILEDYKRYRLRTRLFYLLSEKFLGALWK